MKEQHHNKDQLHFTEYAGEISKRKILTVAKITTSQHIESYMSLIALKNVKIPSINL